METFHAVASGKQESGRGEKRERPAITAFIRSPSVLSLFTMCTYYFDKKFKGEKIRSGCGYF